MSEERRENNALMLTIMQNMDKKLDSYVVDSKEWRSKHEKQDDDRHEETLGKITPLITAESNRLAVYKDRRMAFASIWAGMVFVGWDKLIGLFK
jgi:hypothetical protein